MADLRIRMRGRVRTLGVPWERAGSASPPPPRSGLPVEPPCTPGPGRVTAGGSVGIHPRHAVIRSFLLRRPAEKRTRFQPPQGAGPHRHGRVPPAVAAGESGVTAPAHGSACRPGRCRTPGAAACRPRRGLSRPTYISPASSFVFLRLSSFIPFFIFIGAKNQIGHFTIFKYIIQRQ